MASGGPGSRALRFQLASAKQGVYVKVVEAYDSSIHQDRLLPVLRLRNGAKLASRAEGSRYCLNTLAETSGE